MNGYAVLAEMPSDKSLITQAFYSLLYCILLQILFQYYFILLFIIILFLKIIFNPYKSIQVYFEATVVNIWIF